jgi:hypothetical protein
LTGVPTTPKSLDREPLLVTHSLDLKKYFHIFLCVDPLLPSALLRSEKLEFRFPESQYIRREAGDFADFTDFIEKLLFLGTSRRSVCP